MLTREQILAADDRKYVEAEVPEWGGKVRISSLSAEDGFLYAARLKEKPDDHSITAYLLCRCIVDEAGQRLFTDDDVTALNKKNPRIILELFKKAADLNLLSKESVEEAAKN